MALVTRLPADSFRHRLFQERIGHIRRKISFEAHSRGRRGYRRMNRSQGAGPGTGVTVLSVSPRAEPGRRKMAGVAPVADEPGQIPWKERAERKGKRRRVGMDITWVTDRIAVG